jgi:hypothetical protein
MPKLGSVVKKVAKRKSLAAVVEAKKMSKVESLEHEDASLEDIKVNRCLSYIFHHSYSLWQVMKRTIQEYNALQKEHDRMGVQHEKAIHQKGVLS